MMFRGCGSCRGFGILSFVPVLLIIGLIFIIYCSTMIAGGLWIHQSGGLMAYLAMGLFQVFFVLTVADFILCIIVDPGAVPKSWRPSSEALLEDEEDPEDMFEPQSLVLDPRGVVQGRSLVSCATCQTWKPERSHHCSTCGRCVLKMDHHCVFVNNCIGFTNQKFFFLFVFYGLLGTAMGVLIGLPFFLRTMRTPPNSNDKLFLFGAAVTAESRLGILLMVGWLFSLSMCITLTIFVSFHAYLITTNQTTLESWGFGGRKTYDLGRMKNIKSVMGQNPWLWFLPTQSNGNRSGTEFHRYSTDV